MVSSRPVQGREENEERTQRRVLVAAFCVVPSATLDGMSVLATIRALHRHYAIDVVSVRTETQPHVERMLRARILRVPLAGGSEVERMDSFRRAVRRQIEGEQYDVVHVRGPLEGLPVCELKDAKGFKIVYEFATFPATDGGAAEAARRDEMVCLSTADLVVAGSEAARAHLYQRGVGERVAVIPRGIDVDLFDWDFTRPSPVPVLAALGPFPKSRDVGTLLQAIAIVLREHPVRLRLLGESDRARAEALGEKILTLDLGAAVEITGTVDLDDVPAAIASADVGIGCAGPAERYLRAGDWVPGVLEFMACRRPVVAARVPAIRDVFADRRELLLYEPGDPESLAEAVLTLLRSSARRDALAQAGYRRVREDFPASATRRRLLGVYRTLADPLAERPSGAPSSTSRTPTPISIAGHDTVIVSEGGGDTEDYGAGGTRDTSPGVSLSDIGEPRHVDTDPEIRLKREHTPSGGVMHPDAEPAVVVDPSIFGGDTELPDAAIRSLTPPEPPAADPPTGETDVPELPREQTRSMATSSVSSRKSRPLPAVPPESVESDLAEEPTRAVAVPRPQAARTSDTLDGTFEVALPVAPDLATELPAPPEVSKSSAPLVADDEGPAARAAPEQAPGAVASAPAEIPAAASQPAPTDPSAIPSRTATVIATITPRAALWAPPTAAPAASGAGASARPAPAPPPAPRPAPGSSPGRPASPSTPAIPAVPASGAEAPKAPPRPTTGSRAALRGPLPPPPPAPPPRRPIVPPPGTAAATPTPRPEAAGSAPAAPPPPPAATTPSRPTSDSRPPPPLRPSSVPRVELPSAIFTVEVTARREIDGADAPRPPAPSRTPPPLPAPDFEPETRAGVITGAVPSEGGAAPTLVPASPPSASVGSGGERSADGPPAMREPSSPRVVVLDAPAIVEEVRSARTSSRPPPPPPSLAAASGPAPGARGMTADPPSRPRAVAPSPPLRQPADTEPIPVKRETSAPPPPPPPLPPPPPPPPAPLPAPAAPPAERTPPPREPGKG
jgi:glycosyltransferase involved in cell wall biosynthesis